MLLQQSVAQLVQVSVVSLDTPSPLQECCCMMQCIDTVNSMVLQHRQTGQILSSW